MIGTIYRIRTAVGTEHMGRVQGSGGMLGGAGPKKTPRQAEGGLRILQAAAAELDMIAGVGFPVTAIIWRIFPQFSAAGNGPHVDVDIRGATIEIVDVDTDERPSGGWPRERVKLAWQVYPRVRVDTLKRGDMFFDIGGELWRYLRPFSTGSGAHYVETFDGRDRTEFAGCAEVLIYRKETDADE